MAAILPYMTQTPPSRYEYRSDAEFETAMAEWCRDFEPRYHVIHKDESGQYVRTPFVSRDEAIAFIGTDSVHKTLAARVANKYCDTPVYQPPAEPGGDGKPLRWPSGTLPGGTAAEYKALGL